MCRRIGAVYAYFEFGTVQIDGHPESTETYIWGDRTLQTVRCGKCGCATHWEPLSAKPGAHMGVNLNNFPPGILDTLRIRNFDGADTWSFVD